MPIKIDRNHFYSNFPSSAVYGKQINASRRVGFEAIFDVWDALGKSDMLNGLAYALATAWHETGGRMQPVREGFAASDASAYAIVTAYCASKNIRNYAARHANGNSYYGRGYVQLTHGPNYKKMGKTLGVGQQFYNKPDDVLTPRTGAKILLEGMLQGLFRPKHGTMDKYFSDSHPPKWFDARDMINGDKNKYVGWAKKKMGILIEDYAEGFASALKYH